MYTHSPEWESQPQLDLDANSLQSNIAASHKPSISRPAKSTPSSPVKLPASLHQYLTTTTNPNEIQARLHESREKRLRLLLRRFTNQIQYGCKNTYCSVPTCLSFRKRRSDVPLRPYTDVAARALAWRCVEDYASPTRSIPPVGKPAEYNGPKQNLKVATYQRGDGLCWDEPVIPWYADPLEHFRKHRQAQRQHKIAKETAAQDAQSSSAATHSANLGGLAQPVSPGDSIAATLPSNGYVISDTTEKAAKLPYPNSPTSFDQRIGHADSAPEQFVEPPKDMASFTQMFYDTKAIKFFDHTSDTDVSFGATDHLMSGRDDPKKRGLGKRDVVRDHNDIPTPPTTSQPICTFNILNKGVISWLLNLTTERPNDELDVDECISSTPTTIARLARQSLYYCLAHPLRLLKSAEAWRFDTSISSKDHNEPPTSGGDTTILPQSASDAGTSPSPASTVPLLPTFDEAVMAFDILSHIQPYHEILDNIFAALQHAYILPAHIPKRRISEGQLRNPKGSVTAGHSLSKQTSGHSSIKPLSHTKYIGDDYVASLCLISLLSMCNSDKRFADELKLPVVGEDVALAEIHCLWVRETGQVFPSGQMARSTSHNTSDRRNIYDAILARIDVYNDMGLMRLLESTADIISHRLALYSTMNTAADRSKRVSKQPDIVNQIVAHICRSDDASFMAWSVLDLMCVVLLKKWDRTSTIRRTSPVGGALQLLAGLYRKKSKFSITADSFSFNFVAEALDATKMPIEWLAFRADTRSRHILSYSFLFDPANLVKYFRAANLEIMRRSYEYASINLANAKHFLLHRQIPTFGTKEVLADLRPHMARFFVLTVRRQNMLEDAINQIWRRQRQELMRPLKVNLGKHEGEDGLDHGGVQQEFFRVIFAEALQVDYGMFTIDGLTQMTWFQPGSLEPLYKFEALGVLMSLAVYNSVTLPITFPVAFYRKLLGHKVKNLEHIEDGWPELTKGLRMLQTWEEGDVGDVIGRTYEFSYQHLGTITTIDMFNTGRRDPWPVPEPTLKHKPKIAKSELSPFHLPSSDQDLASLHGSSTGTEQLSHSDTDETTSSTSSSSNLSAIPDAPLVTNDNRDQYIKDYIFWLTDKSIARQFTAFATGFHACLDPVALSIFTPEALKTVIEGYTEIDIDKLQESTTYIEFEATDQFITDFWSVVRDMAPSQHKQLLEFVTACDRVPVNGISSITFIVQNNGADDDRLPSSSTCYGRLLLPKYSSKEILRAKLEKAIENSIGFGSL